jgi:hypothetical protein
LHYRFSTEAGEDIGRKIGELAVRTLCSALLAPRSQNLSCRT